MALNLFRRLITSKSIPRPSMLNKSSPRFYSIYEPEYLEAMKPKYPFYPPLTVQIRGYDFPVLESYQSWIHKIADAFEFDVEDSYAMPAKELKVLRYKPKSTVVEAEYFLKIYERDLKISHVPSVRLPIFIRIIEAAIPEGVMLDIDEWSEEKENFRYIPDKQLLDLKSELDGMKKERDKK